MTTSVDNEALFAAADTGTLWTFWAEQFPDRIAIYSAYGDRTLAETLERIDNCIALREKQTPLVTEWLGSR